MRVQDLGGVWAHEPEENMRVVARSLDDTRIRPGAPWKRGRALAGEPPVLPSAEDIFGAESKLEPELF